MIKQLAILICFVSPCSVLAQKQKPAPPIANAQGPRQATLAEQKMCADQAKKFYNEENTDPKTHVEYSSHYDAKSNVCYVMLHHFYGYNGVMATSGTDYVVYDAFESVERGRYMTGEKGDRLSCSVRPVGKKIVEQIICKDQDEFFDLVKKHFGLDEPD